MPRPNTTSATLLTINGKPFDEFSGVTLADLTQQLELPARQIAVEVNEQLIPRELHPSHQLCDGDRIEIVTLVGGG